MNEPVASATGNAAEGAGDVDVEAAMAELELEHASAQASTTGSSPLDPLHARLHGSKSKASANCRGVPETKNGQLSSASAEGSVDDPLADAPAQDTRTQPAADAAHEEAPGVSAQEPLLAEARSPSIVTSSTPLSARTVEQSPDSSDSDHEPARPTSLRHNSVGNPAATQSAAALPSSSPEPGDAPTSGALFGGLQTEDPDAPSAGASGVDAADKQQLSNALDPSKEAHELQAAQPGQGAAFSPYSSVQASMDLPISMPVRCLHCLPRAAMMHAKLHVPGAFRRTGPDTATWTCLHPACACCICLQ